MSKEEEHNLANIMRHLTEQQTALFKQSFDEFNKNSEARWQRMEPVIKAYEEGVSLRKIFFSLMKGVGVIGAAYVVMKMAWHDFTNLSSTK